MNEDEKWGIVSRNDNAHDGVFYYGVKTTKIFCRPSCPSKTPIRKNVVFFDSRDEALRLGFRPCKRCRPDLLEYYPMEDLLEKAKRIIEENFLDEKLMQSRLLALCVNKTHLAREFTKLYGATPKKYLHKLRIQEAKRLLSRGQTVAGTAFECGYGSLSAFYSNFRKETGKTPAEYIISK